MKTLIAFLVCLSSTIYGQTFTFERESVTFRTDTMEIDEAFKFIGKLLPVGERHKTRYVIKHGVKYQRHYYLINRIINRTYIVDDGKKIVYKG